MSCIFAINTMKESGKTIECIGLGIPTNTVREMLNFQFENDSGN